MLFIKYKHAFCFVMLKTTIKILADCTNQTPKHDINDLTIFLLTKIIQIVFTQFFFFFFILLLTKLNLCEVLQLHEISTWTKSLS